MISELKIFPECYADTLLTETLFPDLKPFVSHKEGSDTARDIEQFPHELVVGIVDKDKKMPSYFRGFQVVSENASLCLHWWKHPEREHHIIILEPAIEKWLYNAVLGSSVRPEEFSLPENLASSAVIKQFKKKHSRRRSPEFCNFLEAVCKQDTEPITTIKSWMKTITNT